MSVKKLPFIVLCALVLFNFPLSALASSEIPMHLSIGINYVYINEASSSLTISNGVANVKGYVQRTPAGTYIQITSTLQIHNNGSWVDVKSWSKSSTSSSASISEKYTVSQGTYRVSTYYLVEGPNGTESGTVYSKTVTF